MGTASSPSRFTRQLNLTVRPDVENHFLHSGPGSMSEILETARKKWPHITVAEITISAEQFQTANLGLDSKNPMDFSIFTKVEARPAYFERMKSKK